MRRLFIFLLFLSPLPGLMAAKIPDHIKIEKGVSRKLADYRYHTLKNIRYQLFFDIPEKKSESIPAEESIKFLLTDIHESLQLDFKQNEDHILGIDVNGNKIKTQLINEHLLIDKSYLKKGVNNIHIKFIAGDQALHRNEDYLYALFVPDRARTVFPCFDQPNLKAVFLLTIQAPKDFAVMANAIKRDSVISGNKITYHFANTERLSTYLFSFTAGKYTYLKRSLATGTAEFLHRETDSVKIRLSVDSIFTAHQNAISFLQNWTGIPFPFQKIGFVAIPDFQFGGMEHPGEVQYKASSLFLDDGATKDMIIARDNLVSHETAHMWFGDMVTMQWFNDVWMKEVFANFMADKVSEKIMGHETFNLKFLQDHYPAAYNIDRTRGSNPIRQPLDNLKDAGSLYGNIIYHKAPIMMRQLELLMGTAQFQKGVQEYLRKYAYKNATWSDLISILSKYTKSDLYKWNQVWVNQTGRPVFDYQIETIKGKISKLNLIQSPEFGPTRTWPQNFKIAFVYADSIKELQVNMNKLRVPVTEALGMDLPQSISFNSDGMGYGVFPIDKNNLLNGFGLKSPVQRASAYIVAYENMLAGRYFTPEKLLENFSGLIDKEQNEMNLKLITGYISTIYWEFITPAKRKTYVSDLENITWKAIKKDSVSNNKKILFKLFQDIYQTDWARGIIYQTWKEKMPPENIKLSEDDYTSLALSIALRTDSASGILDQELLRISNPDRKSRLKFIIPALSADKISRTVFFNSLEKLSNRQKESWVTVALSYLHHPLRQMESINYLPKSLEMLEDIQSTGDIFFPQSWLGSIFSLYQSKEAYEIVTNFLQTHPNLNPQLRAKILQTTDNLYRAQKLVN